MKHEDTRLTTHDKPCSLGDSRMPKRFWAKVRVLGDCWLWVGSSRNGSGIFAGEYSSIAHRELYIQCVGRVPKGVNCRHTCNSWACVNPAHIVLAGSAGPQPLGLRKTQAPLKKKDACKRGHAYDEWGSTSTAGSRFCKLCKSSHNQRVRWLVA